jgi:uncharacterized protein (DUF1778 family)
MPAKNRDSYNRWRSITIAFRVSPEENEQINTMARISGTSKQEYLTANMLRHKITVIRNPKVHKALKEEMKLILERLIQIKDSSELDSEFLQVIMTAMAIYDGMKEE